MGLPQPFADALKLLSKEQKFPLIVNLNLYLFAPLMALTLALIIWAILPTYFILHYLILATLRFLAISSITVYATLGSGWTSNSKYSLLGALRRVAQTISYEVSIILVLLRPLIIIKSFSLHLFINTKEWIFLALPLTFIIWFITALAESNRTPFDFAEGESELVSGFNTEFRRSLFALIFIGEYTRILALSFITAIFIINILHLSFVITPLLILFASFVFLWVRGTLPRIRYDQLIYLTWKRFLPFSIALLLIIAPLTF